MIHYCGNPRGGLHGDAVVKWRMSWTQQHARFLRLLAERGDAGGLVALDEAEERGPVAHRQCLDELILHRSAVAIADIRAAAMNELGGSWTDAHRFDGANPYWYQTEGGLFLEFYYGSPSKVWTPWGSWMFGTGGGSPPDPWLTFERILKRVDLTLHEPEMYRPEYGAFGPIYAVLAVDGVGLPYGRVRTPAERTPYESTKDAWAHLMANYHLPPVRAKKRKG